MTQDLRAKWTDDKVEELKRLWLLDLSAAEIGRQLGVSKSAVTGKVSRLGLACRRSPIIRMTDEEKAERRRQGGYRSPPPLPERTQALADATDRPKRNGFHDRQRLYAAPSPSFGSFQTCQWIEGTPSADDSSKCGKPVEPNDSNWPYCAEHLKRAIGKKAPGDVA